MPLGVDGAYEGWCDSWDSFGSARGRMFHLSLIRADVGVGPGHNIVQVFI